MGQERQESPVVSESTVEQPDPANPDHDLVILVRMRSFEADLARAKLESEGIPCFVRDSNMAALYTFLVSEVPLLVRRMDVESARAILNRPASSDVEGEYVEENWRCPKCHSRKVHLFPYAGIWKMTRNMWLLMIVATLLYLLLELIGKAPGFTSTWSPGGGMWMLIMAGLTLALLLAPRQKRCDECKHIWNA